VLLVSFTAFGINYLLMGFAPSIEWLFLAQALAGLFGATPAVAGAFIADITPKENRAKRYGSLGAAFGLGFMFGPVLSGLLAEYGLRTPIFVAALLTLSNAVLGFFVFRESLAQYLRRPFKLVNASPWGVFMQLRVNKQIPRLLLVVLCLHIALNTVPTVWPYFTAFQFQWTPREIGLSMGMYGIVSIIAQGFAVGRISQRFGDLVASLTGMLGLLIGSIAFAVISDLYWLLPFIIPSAMGFMTNAGLMSYMSAHTDPSSQGTLQGAFAATRSVGAIITPLTLPWLFHLFTTPNNAYPVYPGIPFVIASLLAACAILLLLRANRLAHSQA
tara:strand:- start:2048 stop:3037 length:990 start_codon:yes stop_codon:yes gene_type:complete